MINLEQMEIHFKIFIFEFNNYVALEI